MYALTAHPYLLTHLIINLLIHPYTVSVTSTAIEAEHVRVPCYTTTVFDALMQEYVYIEIEKCMKTCTQINICINIHVYI